MKSRHTLLFLGLQTLAFATLSADYMDDIGFTELQTKTSSTMLDGNQLTGAGIEVGIVEALSGGNYAPNTGASQYSGKTITLESGASGTSNHANTVGGLFFGNNGIAPGITTISAFETNSWLSTEFLRTSEGSLTPPEDLTTKVYNHSWVGSSEVFGEEMLLRTDYAVDTYGIINVVGVNNGSANGVPQLMASSFNSIAVGRSDGNHSAGTPASFGTNRTKPDIVAPQSATSFATPLVSAAATLLLEAAASNTNATEGANAQESEMVRAFLMGGATKNDLSSWSNTSSQPLDSVFGAGELNVANSYEILASGEFESSTNSLVSTTGWDFSTASNLDHLYFFEVPEGFVLEEFTAFLTWNAQIADNFANGIVYDLDLYLYEASGFTTTNLVNSSTSEALNNHELIYESTLESGRYAIHIPGVAEDANFDYADFGLTWFGELNLESLTAVPEASTFSWLVALTLLTLLRARRKSSPSSEKA